MARTISRCRGIMPRMAVISIGKRPTKGMWNTAKQLGWTQKFRKTSRRPSPRRPLAVSVEAVIGLMGMESGTSEMCRRINSGMRLLVAMSRSPKSPARMKRGTRTGSGLPIPMRMGSGLRMPIQTGSGLPMPGKTGSGKLPIPMIRGSGLPMPMETSSGKLPIPIQMGSGLPMLMKTNGKLPIPIKMGSGLPIPMKTTSSVLPTISGQPMMVRQRGIVARSNGLPIKMRGSGLPRKALRLGIRVLVKTTMRCMRGLRLPMR
ncbi:unnamed protein product [Symbiodinium sp. CCMP2456]|nr:unnamed protein product [Symbiodinium sp. CCMP2456]